MKLTRRVLGAFGRHFFAFDRYTSTPNRQPFSGLFL